MIFRITMLLGAVAIAKCANSNVSLNSTDRHSVDVTESASPWVMALSQNEAFDSYYEYDSLYDTFDEDRYGTILPVRLNATTYTSFTRR